jgi:hypothetical protein
MKAFVFGVVVGAVACFSVIRVMDPRVGRDAAPERLLAGSAAPSSYRDIGPARAAASAETLGGSAEGQSGVEIPALDRSLNATPPSVPSKAGKDWMQQLTEQEASELCTRASQLRQAREQTAKDAEPKDAGWAYSMEQLIRQHIEMHLPADKYTKLLVECRTTFCELRMEGSSTDGGELAEKVVQQIQHQEWSDIAQKGSGGGSNGETWYVEYDWFRPRSESERRRWFWNRDLKRERR